jgi:hypothetical protein
MNNRQNLAIATLLVTAAVLSGLLVLTANTEPAYGRAASVKGGDYIMVAGAYNQTKDFVYVINRATQEVNMYEINLQKNAIDVLDRVNLAAAFR